MEKYDAWKLRMTKIEGITSIDEIDHLIRDITTFTMDLLDGGERVLADIYPRCVNGCNDNPCGDCDTSMELIDSGTVWRLLDTTDIPVDPKTDRILCYIEKKGTDIYSIQYSIMGYDRYGLYGLGDDIEQTVTRQDVERLIYHLIRTTYTLETTNWCYIVMIELDPLLGLGEEPYIELPRCLVENQTK